MRIVVVRPDEYVDRVRSLAEAHWRECGFDFPFEPDVEAYQRLSDAGVLFALVAQEGEEILGYCTVILSPHLFNRTVVVAASDALFVTPSARRSLVSGRLVHAAEDEARERGATRFAWHCRAGTPLAEMLRAHGYATVDEVVARAL